ncbi:MAG: InlB B-repeat-containing protein [Fibrobacter sp.]|nr:InlB B-repeat-containing protein [Fibrobacter sp.]
MNKKLLTTSVFLATSIAMAFEPWIGFDTPTPYYVNTGLDNGTNTAGYWFVATDEGDGGKSKVVWPVATGNELNDDSLDPIIDFCKGVCGTADLDKGTLTYTPFITLGFNVAGEDANSGKLASGNASEWGGICITYRSDIALYPELSLGDAIDAEIGYALPTRSIPKAQNGTKKCIPWSDFKQPSWYKGATKISGPDAAKQLVSINFKMQGAKGQYKFNICAIGPYGEKIEGEELPTGAKSLPTTCPKVLTMHPEISVSAKWSKGDDGYDATITVKDGEKELTEGTDYEIESNVNDATGIVIKTITGKGDYAGSVVKSLVPYIDENGEPQVMYDATVLTNNKDGVTELSGGWYVATGKVNMAGIKFNGEAHLILADDAEMVIETGDEHGIYASNNLTIYGQTEQNGILKATGNKVGIYSEEGNITISGGSVTASGNEYGIVAYNGVTISGGSVTAYGYYDGIYAYNGVTISGGSVTADGYYGIYGENGVSISGGTVKATSYYDGIYAYNGVTISGGSVTADGYYGIYSENGVSISGGSVTAFGYYDGIYGVNGITINGGTVEATGNEVGIFSKEGIITLDWTNSTDFIKASSYYSKNGVSIAEGKYFKDKDGYYVYSGTLNAGQLSSLKGQKIEPFKGVSVSFVDNSSETPTVFASIAIDGEGNVAAPAKHPIRTGYTFAGWFTAPKGGSEFDFTATVTVNTTAYAHWNENTTSVEYIDENGKTQILEPGDYTVLTNDIYVEDLPEGWYVVEGEVKYTSTVSFSGNAHLILADGAKMEIESEGGDGIDAWNNLTIYGQSNQNGILNATGNEYGIYSNSYITISGGTVTVTATGGDYGIYSYEGVSISGGSVTATGEDYGIYGYNGITLGWTNDTDHITASSYYSVNGSVSIAKDKSFKDEKGKEYSGTIDDVSDIAGKTLVPSSFNGKFLSDVNVAVADIPVQKYADGKPVCPSVVVTDGKDTLTAGTDYTVTCVNNTAVTSANLDEAAIAQITGKGNYAGAIQKRFFIWENIGNYAAVQVFQDADGKTHAEIDGAYDGTDAVAIDEYVENVAVKFNRKFPKGKYSTIVLPFDVNTENVEGFDAVLRYNGIKTVNGESSVRMKVVWATSDWVEKNDLRDKNNNLIRYDHADLTANTPYLIQVEQENLKVNGGVTLKTTAPADVSIDDWTFRGTWQYKKWGHSCSTEGQNCDRETDNAYGFAASSSDDDKINVGDFVRVGEGAWILPMRAYLVSTDILESTPPAQGVRANGNYVKRPSFAQEELPEFMSIVIDVDDEGKETTVIGQFNTRTGEIKMNYDRGKFDLKGRRVNGTNNARGAYYGKKVLKKY